MNTPLHILENVPREIADLDAEIAGYKAAIAKARAKKHVLEDLIDDVTTPSSQEKTDGNDRS